MTEQDRIGQVFKNSTVFITGGTGFLGKILIEKLLRCCEVEKLYLLVRTKKGKSPEERLNDIFSNVLFSSFKSKNPSSISKCEVIHGDITRNDLGISHKDRLRLQNEVNFIFHSGASTRFDDSVKTAVITNTRSTRDILNLAEECKKLKAFVHISTAYAFPKQKVLYEKAYEPPKDPHQVLEIIKNGQNEEIEKLLGDCPNTYTFSKALAEALVVEKMDKVSSIIMRPSVVCPIWKEPLKGWCNNLQGPIGICVGAGKGIIRSMYMKGDFYADFIPADVVINGWLVAVWYYLEKSKKHRIFNETSSDYLYSWEEILETGKSIIYNDVPFNGVVWYPGGSIKKFRWLHNMCFYLFQLLPAIFVDLLLMILGYKPILYQIQKRIQKGCEVFEYYTDKPWNFSNLKSEEVRNQMNELEKQIYKVDGNGVDLREYLKECLLFARRNILKETDDTIAKAKKHMKIMWIVDVITKVLLGVWTLYCSYTLFLKPLQ